MGLLMLAIDVGKAEMSGTEKPQQEGLLYNLEFDQATGNLQCCEACKGRLGHLQVISETCLMCTRVATLNLGGITLELSLHHKHH